MVIAEFSDGPGGAGDQELIVQRIARLSSGQLDCLRLVDQHLSCKEIAGKLKISPHTVDQRIRQLLQILGVSLMRWRFASGLTRS